VKTVRGQKEWGLTLIEIIVTLLLFAVAGLALIGLFTNLLVKASVDSDTIAAELLAYTILERARAEGPPGWGVPNLSPATQTEQIHSADRKQPTTFVYQLEVNSIDNHSLGEVYRLAVKVEWGSAGLSAGKGRQTLERTSVFYDEV
jgi:type II secretory pathway pseudopilin PulG